MSRLGVLPRGAEKVGGELGDVKRGGDESDGGVREEKAVDLGVDVTVKLGVKRNRRNRRGGRGKRKKGGVQGNIVEDVERKEGGKTSEKDQAGICTDNGGRSDSSHAASASGPPESQCELKRENGGNWAGNRDGDVSMLGCISGVEIGQAPKRRRKEGKTEKEAENENNTEEQSQREKGREARKRSVKKPIVRITVREDDDSSPAACVGYWYYHLRIILHPPEPTSTSISTLPDIITWRTLLTASLTKLFGVQGSAAQIDILKVFGWDAWVRAVDVGGQVVPVAHGRSVAAAFGGYVGVWRGGEVRVGIRVLRSAKWLVALLVDTGTSDEEADLWKDA